MLDMKFVRENPDVVVEAVKKRNGNLDLTEFLELDKKRREITVQVETLKSERNSASQEIGKLKKAGQDATEQMAAVRALGDKIAEDDKELKAIEVRLKEILLTIPNIPADDVPVGADDSANPVVRTWGEPTKFEFEPKAHWDIGEGLNIIDFERGVKVSGARYVFYRGLGARLERAVISFFLDLHTEKHGYTEMFPPFIVNGASMQGTGQLPKFAEDMFKLENGDMYLIPTAEVPVTNYHRDEILTAAELPIRYTAYSGCFRAE
ncbi:MAG: serine--tRNA ligase, partial [Phascolarctobacterium sp.]|nr:serine--tRNA ligase [Phascolarctobacterium sp.]